MDHVITQSLPQVKLIYRQDRPWSPQVTLTISAASEELSRLLPRLSDFGFDIVRCASIQHQVVDEVSRLATNGADKTQLDEEVLVLNDNYETSPVVYDAEMEQGQ